MVDPVIGRIVRITSQAFTMLTLAGDTVLVMPNRDAPAVGAFSADGRSLWVAPNDEGAILRAVPLDGGKAIDLSTNKEYFWPIGWSSDSRTAYAKNGAGTAMLVASLDGAVRRTIPLDPQPRPTDFGKLSMEGVSGDGRHVLVVERGGNGAGLRRGYLYDTQTRTLRKLTDSLGVMVEGAGGHYLNYQHATGEFFFLQRTGGQTVAQTNGLPREIRAAKPTGPSRLVRRVPSANDSARGFIVHGDRVFWTVTRKDTTSLYLARGTAPAVRIWSTTRRLVEPVLSNSGTRMALAMEQPSVDGLDRVRFEFLRIDASGQVTADGSSATFGTFWDAYWTPDDRALIALENPTDLDTRLMRVPVDGSAVSYILRPGTTTFWDHYLSPNAKYSLVPAESPRGASVWRIDLAAAERAWKQQRGAVR
jgi:hypothetical protein